MTSVAGRVVRPIGLDTFADITTAPVVTPEGITRDGLLFDGVLTDAQVLEVWERMTSADDLDQARRAAVRDAVPCCHAAAVLAAYVLGDEMPDTPGGP